MEYDVFICHASEDKDFVEPLANALKDKGLRVWYDRFELTIGDGLRQKIDYGLSNSRYGIVVLSKSFFTKSWPKSELDALAGRQNAEGRKVILPIWHEIEANDVRNKSPLLHSLLAARSSDGMEFVVGQIVSVCSEPIESPKKTVFQTSTEIGLRESCLEIIRENDVLAWRKLVDELQAPIDNQLIEWKKDSESNIGHNPEAWRASVVRAIEICLPGFAPLFAAAEAGQKERWKDAVGILHHLALLENKMGGGAVPVLQIGQNLLCIAGSIGMAIATQIKNLNCVWNWMCLDMPYSIRGLQRKWAEIRAVFWIPFIIDYKEPFSFLISLYNSEYLKGFFANEERMNEFLFKTNLLQSIVELRLLTSKQEGAEVVEKLDTRYKSNLNVLPFWYLIKPDNFSAWTWDLFGSSEGFIRFFMMDSGGHIEPSKIWDWWKGWKEICKACVDDVTGHMPFLRGEWLMLPGEPT